MKPYAAKFYKSQAWKHTQKEYSQSVGYLCERCKANDQLVPGVIVHHITHITPANINDTDITLSWNNLMLLCRKCHGEIHGKNIQKRFDVNPDGSIVPLS